VVQQQNQANNSHTSSVNGQKKNRTIQLFMQELFDEKAPEDLQSQQTYEQQMEPNTFYQGSSS
jgi:hypothetical protein